MGEEEAEGEEDDGEEETEGVGEEGEDAEIPSDLLPCDDDAVAAAVVLAVAIADDVVCFFFVQLCSAVTDGMSQAIRTPDILMTSPGDGRLLADDIFIADDDFHGDDVVDGKRRGTSFGRVKVTSTSSTHRATCNASVDVFVSSTAVPAGPLATAMGARSTEAKAAWATGLLLAVEEGDGLRVNLTHPTYVTNVATWPSPRSNVDTWLSPRSNGRELRVKGWEVSRGRSDERDEEEEEEEEE